MRACLAALTVVLILLVTTFDRVACPDGCADADGHATEAASSLCGICHGWSEPRPAASLSPATARTRPPSPIAPPARTAHPPAIDHPPRLA